MVVGIVVATHADHVTVAVAVRRDTEHRIGFQLVGGRSVAADCVQIIQRDVRRFAGTWRVRRRTRWEDRWDLRY